MPYSSCGTKLVSNRGQTIRKVMGVVGDFQLVRIYFFFAHYLCRIFFFSVETPLTVKSWFIIYLFMIYKLFYTHNRSKDTGHFLMQNLFENVHTVREEEATWSGRHPCAFLQSLPSGIPLPQPFQFPTISFIENSSPVRICSVLQCNTVSYFARSLDQIW